MLPLRRTATSISLAALLTVGAAWAAGGPALAATTTSPTAQHGLVLAAKPSAVKSWAAKQYGTFTTLKRSGSGDDVVNLPRTVKAAIVTASTEGESNFIVQGLNAKNSMKALLVNEIGAYDGTSSFGLEDKGAVRRLKVTADGDWTIVIKSVSKAGNLPTRGSGDGVYLFSRSVGSLRLTHRGESNFIVTQHTGGRFGWDLLVNDIGAYTGTVPYKAGSSVVVVQADGAWTAKKR